MNTQIPPKRLTASAAVNNDCSCAGCPMVPRGDGKAANAAGQGALQPPQHQHKLLTQSWRLVRIMLGV